MPEHLHQAWTDLRSHLGEVEMRTVLFAADKLRERPSSERTINGSEIDGLLSAIDSLLEQVLKSGVPEDLKPVVAEALNELRTAVLRYRLRGVKALEEGFDRTVGSMWRNKELWSRLKDQVDVAKGVGDILVRVSGAIALARQTVPALQAAGAWIQGLLGSP